MSELPISHESSCARFEELAVTFGELDALARIERAQDLIVEAHDAFALSAHSQGGAHIRFLDDETGRMSVTEIAGMRLLSVQNGVDLQTQTAHGNARYDIKAQIIPGPVTTLGEVTYTRELPDGTFENANPPIPTGGELALLELAADEFRDPQEG